MPTLQTSIFFQGATLRRILGSDDRTCLLALLVALLRLACYFEMMPRGQPLEIEQQTTNCTHHQVVPFYFFGQAHVGLASLTCGKLQKKICGVDQGE